MAHYSKIIEEVFKMIQNATETLYKYFGVEIEGGSIKLTRHRKFRHQRKSAKIRRQRKSLKKYKK